jgi:DNA adenine methylase
MSNSASDVGDATPWCRPILRWAGSKRHLVPLLLRSLPANFERYVEPFAGSACLFFALYPQRALLGDINADLMNVYETLRAHPRRLAATVKSIRHSKQTYLRIRSASPNRNDPLKRAAHFVYLNRHCFNGVYRTNRMGRFNVPMGTNTGAMPTDGAYFRCSVALRKAKFVTADFETTCALAGRADFVYLDPPYSSSERPRYGEYGYESFQPLDLGRLKTVLESLDGRGCSFLLSYADSRKVRHHLRRWSIRPLLVRRHVAGFVAHRAVAQEVLVSNYPIRAADGT